MVTDESKGVTTGDFTGRPVKPDSVRPTTAARDAGPSPGSVATRRPICCGRIRWGQDALRSACLVGHRGRMTITSLDDELTRQLMHQRIVVLGQALEEDNGNRLMHQLLLLSAEDKRTDISLWINSPGGSVSAMLAIRDVMRLIPNDVATLAMGMAASAGQFLLSAGAPGKRHALPHARILLHQGSAGIGGTAMDIEIQATDLRYTRDTVLALVSEDTGQSVETIERDSRRDRWFSAEEAREYGFVDHVVASVDDVAPSGNRPLVGLGRPVAVAR
jgi:ATP-dependent Clp protease protease subunit